MKVAAATRAERLMLSSAQMDVKCSSSGIGNSAMAMPSKGSVVSPAPVEKVSLSAAMRMSPFAFAAPRSAADGMQMPSADSRAHRISASFFARSVIGGGSVRCV